MRESFMVFKGTCVRAGAQEHMPLNSITNSLQSIPLHKDLVRRVVTRVMLHSWVNVWILLDNSQILKNIKKITSFCVECTAKPVGDASK
jgi:hypothetical protein